ncbi:hypothetical protein OPQ81_006183 [Rhizoctonia solani]|nr:hypothetical protein OPQ81_006183 [Rhizoctonia solani]
MPATPQFPSQAFPRPRRGGTTSQHGHGAHSSHADGTVGRAGAAAAAVLFETGSWELRTGFRLGKADSHSVVDVEVVGILLAAYLVSKVQADTIIEDIMIYSDSQAAILCVKGDTEDALQELLEATTNTVQRVMKGSGGTPVHIKWCPGHSGVRGNEMANRAAREAGYPHSRDLIPQFLGDYHLPTNPTTRKHATKTKNRKLAETHWTISEAGTKFAFRFPNLSPRLFLPLTHGLTRSRATLLFRLVTGHVQLRQHLYRLQLVDSP